MSPHPFAEDLELPADHRGERSCRHCPLPRANRVHELPDTADAQAEHLRRIGEDQDQ